MDDALTESKRRFAQELVSSRKLDIEPLIADQWITISLLQKSIRRGEVETAQRAAFTLFAQKGSAIWRRFMVIAFEDVGAASPNAVAMTVAASTDSSWRGKNGGDLHIAVQLARVLAEAPKSRSAEHLITSAQHHPSLAKARMLRGAIAPGTWYVNVLASYPQWRSKGLGTALLKHAEKLAFAAGVKKGMSVIVADNNKAARRLYERMGYRPVADRPMVKENWESPGSAWILLLKES